MRGLSSAPEGPVSVIGDFIPGRPPHYQVGCPARIRRSGIYLKAGGQRPFFQGFSFVLDWIFMLTEQRWFGKSFASPTSFRQGGGFLAAAILLFAFSLP